MCIAGVQAGDAVLSNAFTFTAAPSAIHHIQANPVLIECNNEWGLDCADLERKVADTGARVLLMSYMRGHVPDMDKIMRVVKQHNLFLIEDCAHANMTTWDGIPLGRFGQIACFSSQSSKALSSGEGGILTTDIQKHAAKAILYAGSYEALWKRHFDINPELMDQLQNVIPGYSMRMSEITGALLRPQIPRLHELREIHRKNYFRLEEQLTNHPNIIIPKPHPKAGYFCDTLQFHLKNLSRSQADQFIRTATMEGLHLQIFGAGRNARHFRQWLYLEGTEKAALPETVRHIEFACDLPLPSSLTSENIDTIAIVIKEVLESIVEENP